MPKTQKRKPVTRGARPAPATSTRDLIHAAKARLRDEKLLVTLSRKLERVIRRTDYRLVDLGGALLARGAVLAARDADADLAREAAINGAAAAER